MFRPALAFVLACAAALGLAGCDEAVPAAETIRPVLVVRPQPAGEAQARYPGEVRARHEPELAFRIAGKVIERGVEVGQRVRQGQVLARLDPQDVRLQLEAARAQVSAAEAALQVASAERARHQTLLDRQLVSRSQFDAVDNQYRAAEARLKQARAEHEVAGNQVGYAELRAPQEGVIARRAIEVGQVVAAGQVAFVLAVQGEREVAIDLPEQDVARYRIGQPVSVALWSQPGRDYAGRIRELAPAADSRSRTYSARVAFVEAEVPAELGQSALVAIRSAEQVPLAVPLSAVTAEQGRPYVWRVRPDATLERVPVRTGPFGEALVPVLEGLGAEDWVVLAGGHLLQEGQTVRPLDRDNRPVRLTRE